MINLSPDKGDVFSEMFRVLRPGGRLGSMVPGEMLHEVWPYRGDEPRISLSWNIGREALPDRREYHDAIIGSARERWRDQRS